MTPKSNTEDEPTPYALKTISKCHFLKKKMILSVLHEKNVMESVDHPFLLHMVSSFQDEYYFSLLNSAYSFSLTNPNY